ncbi:sulfatase [Zobellia galactanivorans]|uniref:Sulfatase, family S1-16 n=1 Tax=Zobellia galactanivorans (strain DSM 12802 / CCUG 47099 / CIP 106680 / NCIMB 13871 / Dsij) TaxID=63186 RepID=G0L8K9_ZOBGA|nr:sulfatase [Zobellia galactanivorans]CAZ97647.1 Sulfatase, family S1-16 [Zobellia galactanivorans]
MNARTYKILYIVLPALLAFQSCKPVKIADPVQKKPNIVIINIDDLGYKDVGFMGSTYYETPNLDALAAEGMVFYNAYAGAANCAPSRACLISGLNTPRHGVYTVSPSDRGHIKTRKLVPIQNTDHLNDTIFTLPQMLKSAGYVTGSFGKWHVGKDPGTQGIDVNIGGSGRGNPGKGGYFSPYNIDHITNGKNGEYLTDRLTDEAIRYIEKYKDSTFFLYMPYYTVHTPIMGKAELVAKFEAKAGQNGQNRPDYAAMVYAMDQNVGKLLKALKQNGLEGNTLVIFTSDNGGIRAISEQSPLRAGKGSYYEGGIRVPLIIKWPGKIQAQSISTAPVSHLDFYPTLQSIATPGRKAEFLDGINLEPVLYGKGAAERQLYFHFPIYLQKYSGLKDQARDSLFRTRPGSVIISGDWKLHEYFEDGALELYNLKTDIGETTNLAKQNPLKTQQMYDELKKWRTATHAPIPTQVNPAYEPTKKP